MSTLIAGNLHDIRERVVTLIPTYIPALILGPPGVGKSAVINSIAKEFNLKVIDVRLSQCDPTDLLGFPVVDKEKNIADYAPMATFPLEGDKIPEGYDGWLIFLDELNGADRGTMKASYKLLHDRMVGNKKLHKCAAIIGAGNHDTDGALTEELATPLKSRVVHMHVLSDHKVWSEWASNAGIDYRIRSFIRANPSELNNFNPNELEGDVTFSCERTWEFAHKILQSNDRRGEGDKHLLPLLAGAIGEGAARKFLAFTASYSDLPDIDEIRLNPTTARLPEKVSGRWAISGVLAEFADEEDIESYMTYLERLPKEFQVVTLRDMYKKNADVLDIPRVEKWVAENNTVLF